jgi:hypothetical protein
LERGVVAARQSLLAVEYLLKHAPRQSVMNDLALSHGISHRLLPLLLAPVTAPLANNLLVQFAQFGLGSMHSDCLAR